MASYLPYLNPISSTINKTASIKSAQEYILTHYNRISDDRVKINDTYISSLSSGYNVVLYPSPEFLAIIREPHEYHKECTGRRTHICQKCNLHQINKFRNFVTNNTISIIVDGCRYDNTNEPFSNKALTTISKALLDSDTFECELTKDEKPRKRLIIISDLPKVEFNTECKFMDKYNSILRSLTIGFDCTISNMIHITNNSYIARYPLVKSVITDLLPLSITSSCGTRTILININTISEQCAQLYLVDGLPESMAISADTRV